MRFDSVHWDWDTGVCVKHYLPQVPCPICMLGSGDDDLEIVISESDRIAEEFGANLLDMVPNNLRDRVANGSIPTRNE